MSGSFVISLDFELLWGVRDHADRYSYGANVLGVRKALPRILELFERHGIAATWATVGFVFCGSRDELMHNLPPKEKRPTYFDERLSSYAYLDEIGRTEKEDPFYLGASLVSLIAQTPRQEIGTHTLSHYYCLEPGQTVDQFEADLTAAIGLARQKNIYPKSIVFPRNQYASRHLEVCKKHGLLTYRGTPPHWIHKPAPGVDQIAVRRALRLLDAHSNFLGTKTFEVEPKAITNLPASQFMRPYSKRLALIHPIHLQAVRRGMTQAAKSGQVYHLWWHPHNFGQYLSENLDALEAIASHFQYLRDRFGTSSKSMGDLLP